MQMMVKAGIPASLENYEMFIVNGLKLEELSEKAALDIIVKKETPTGWGEVSIYME